MITDPDKKVEKAKKARPGLYQSSQHPHHFENEGEEYVDNAPLTKSINKADSDTQLSKRDSK